ncbi:hypothetical protein CONPUDRAFT_73279 [Coniophora puteana RWD-64-598 SS2]|uniref:Uncharacterized protein n=1 Tax=Coniophora puteana (strain RWD-64-598) TaxID=741705 RepID=A0A5M3MS72_CONPW|nr:uncharacterized protein CONPUDRAFT_73279 [Coniophora puteana RWD-64-598 SS2]EIW81594.1 hypothetical protein CONPUDRAFT_73279 [Coniophora puteana RWD-64-598 SS2]
MSHCTTSYPLYVSHINSSFSDKMELNVRIQRANGMAGQHMVHFDSRSHGPPHQVTWYSDIHSTKRLKYTTIVRNMRWATGVGRTLHAAQEDAARQALAIDEDPTDRRAL